MPQTDQVLKQVVGCFVLGSRKIELVLELVRLQGEVPSGQQRTVIIHGVDPRQGSVIHL